MFVIGVGDNPMNMGKNIDGFLADICPKYRLWGILRGYPLVNEGSKGVQTVQCVAVKGGRTLHLI